MAKAKIEIDTNVRGQFTSAGRIVRELSKYSPAQRKRILEVVAEANYDLPKSEPEQAELPVALPDAGTPPFEQGYQAEPPDALG